MKDFAEIVLIYLPFIASILSLFYAHKAIGLAKSANQTSEKVYKLQENATVLAYGKDFELKIKELEANGEIDRANAYRFHSTQLQVAYLKKQYQEGNVQQKSVMIQNFLNHAEIVPSERVQMLELIELIKKD